ncbi:MAG: hypothetical protein KDC38_04590, partial [Planctomycetes bacterium]|nr:hypothetical protein [Planctomycetota bacterium]
LAGVDRATPTGSVPRRQVREFANRVERITNSSTYGLNWRLWGVLYLLGLAAGLALPPFLIAAVIPVPTPIAVGIFTLSGAAWAFLFWTKLKPRWIEPLRLRTAYAIARRCYRGVWRRELLQLVRSSHLPLRVIENELEAIEDENITNDDWIAMLMREDPALTLLEMAQGFLH